MLQFTAQGYLEPSQAIQTDLETIESTFIINEARQLIWLNFQTFIREFQEVIGDTFTVWLNGSFTTQKEFPKDIDCVIFVDYRIYEAKGIKLFNIKTSYKKMGIDAYIVPQYPEKHKNYNIYEMDRKEWFLLFTHTRRDILTGVSTPKGFLTVNF